MMRPLVALALSMMVLESRGLMVNGSITRMLILSELDLYVVCQRFWFPCEGDWRFSCFIILMHTFLELISSSKSFMESHSGANDGHMVIVGFVDDLSGKEQGTGLYDSHR